MNLLYKLLIKGGGAAGLPQSANIVFNIKADSLALADNATVSTWTDSTANALTFTGSAIFKTNQIGTKPAVRFNGGGSQFMTAARSGTALDTALSSQINTVMIVGKSFGTNSVGCMFGSNAGGNSCFFVIDGTQASSTIGRYTGGTSACPSGYNAANMFVSANTSTTTVISQGTGVERQYLNGTCVGASTAPMPAPNQTNFAIGAIPSGALAALVDIFDIVVWDKVLTPTEVFQATSFFYDKYAQTKPWAAGTRVVVFDGDSITSGVGAADIAGTYPFKTAASMGLTYGQWTNLGIGGITMANMITKLPEWSGLGTAIGKNMRVAAFEYFNQKALGASAIQTQNNSYATTVRGYANTKLALGTSTSASTDPDATRDAVNAYYDTNFATYSDSYAALHLNASIGTTGAYAANSGTHYSDTVHLNNTGYTVLAGMFTTALNAIP